MLKIINPILFLSLILQLATIIGFNLIKNPILFKLHGLNGYILIILALIHLFLNRKWVIQQFKK